MAERDGQARRAVEPAVAHDLEEVLRRRRVGDGHAQLDDVLGVRAVQAHAERLVVQDPLAVDVLDDHVEDLGVVVDLGLELEVGRDDDLDVEQAARHGADVRGELDARDLVHEAVERLAHLRELHELRQVARLQVVVPVPRDLLLLELPRDRLRHPPELPEGALRRPEPPLDHLAQRQGLVRRRRPAALERHLEERAAEPRGRLAHERHVGDEREALEAQVRDVGLQQRVHLGRRLVHALLDGDRHARRELRELELLLRADVHVAELAREREEAEELDVREVRLEVLVVRRHRLRRDVVVRGDAAERRRAERARAPVVGDEAVPVQPQRRRVREVEAPLEEARVVGVAAGGGAVALGRAQRADVEVRVREPGRGVAHVAHGAERDLGVEVVGQVLDELRLDRQLLVHEAQVVLELRVLRDHDALALGVVLRPPGAPEHLHDVERAQLDPAALLRRVDLRALDDHGVRGQVDAPRQRRRRAQHLDVAVGEEVLDERAVRARQARVVDREAVREEVLERLGLGRLALLLQDLARRRVLAHEAVDRVVVERHVAQRRRRLRGLGARVHEDEDLVPARLRQHLLVADLVHQLEPLERLLLGDADVLLLQRHGPEAVVEEEHARGRLDAEQLRHVREVGQRRRQAHEPHGVARRLDLADRPRDDRLEDGPAVVVEQVDLVDDDQAHELRVRAVAALARDDVPLLRRRDDDLGRLDLRDRQRLVARQLADLHAVRREALAEVEHDLLHEGLHRRDVDDLERVEVDAAARVVLRVLAVRGEAAQHRQHGDVRLAGARRRAEQQVLRRPQRRRQQLGLDRVQRPHAGERGPRPRGQRVDGHERDLRRLRVDRRRHVDLLVALLLRAPRLGRQLAPAVRHLVRAARERERVEVQDARRRARAAAARLGRRRRRRRAGRRRVVVGARQARALAVVELDAAELRQPDGLAARPVREVRRAVLRPRLRRPRLRERLEDRRAAAVDVGRHLRAHGLGLGLGLRLLEPRAVEDAAPVREERLDEVEAVVVEQHDEPRLARALVAAVGPQRRQDVARQQRRRVRVLDERRDAALEPVRVDGVDVERRRAVRARGARGGRGVVAHARQQLAVARGLDAPRRVVVLLLRVDLVDVLRLVVALVLVEDHRHAHLLVEAAGVVAAGAGAGAAGVEVGHALAPRDERREPLVGHARAQQPLELRVAVGVADAVALEDVQRLLGRAGEHVARRVAQGRAHVGEDRLVRRAGLLGPRPVAAAVGAVVGAVAVAAVAAPPPLLRRQVLRVAAPPLLAARPGAPRALVAVRRAAAADLVAHALRAHAPPERLDLARRLVGAPPRLPVRLEHEVRVRAVLVLPVAGELLGHGFPALFACTLPSAKGYRTLRWAHSLLRATAPFDGLTRCCLTLLMPSVFQAARAIPLSRYLYDIVPDHK